MFQYLQKITKNRNGLPVYRSVTTLSIYISALTLAALLSASLFLSHTRPPEPVYSTVNKLSDRAPSPHLYSPVEFDKSPMHSIPHFPHYHVGLLPDSEITRYWAQHSAWDVNEACEWKLCSHTSPAWSHPNLCSLACPAPFQIHLHEPPIMN